MNNAILTSGLTKRYGRTVAVDNLALQVSQGEIYAFLGLNGAGKTTTIRMLLGMIRPSSGKASILGIAVDAGAREVWSDVGYLVEKPYAYPELTVRENLEVVRRLRRVSETRAVDRIIDRLGLVPYAERPARTLSFGNAQRLGLAKALLHEPKLLVLDEPANGLDPAGVVEVRELLSSLARDQGVTIFMSSHVLGEVARLATRIGIIHEGRLLEELSTDDLERRARSWLVVDTRDRAAARTILASAGFDVVLRPDGALEVAGEKATQYPERIVTLLVEAGVPPIHLSVEREDLETHFLRLVGVENGVSL